MNEKPSSTAFIFGLRAFSQLQGEKTKELKSELKPILESILTSEHHCVFATRADRSIVEDYLKRKGISLSEEYIKKIKSYDTSTGFSIIPGVTTYYLFIDPKANQTYIDDVKAKIVAANKQAGSSSQIKLIIQEISFNEKTNQYEPDFEKIKKQVTEAVFSSSELQTQTYRDETYQDEESLEEKPARGEGFTIVIDDVITKEQSKSDKKAAEKTAVVEEKPKEPKPVKNVTQEKEPWHTAHFFDWETVTNMDDEDIKKSFQHILSQKGHSICFFNINVGVPYKDFLKSKGLSDNDVKNIMRTSSKNIFIKKEINHYCIYSKFSENIKNAAAVIETENLKRVEKDKIKLTAYQMNQGGLLFDKINKTMPKKNMTTNTAVTTTSTTPTPFFLSKIASKIGLLSAEKVNNPPLKQPEKSEKNESPQQSKEQEKIGPAPGL